MTLRRVAAAAAGLLLSATVAQAQSLGFGGKAGVNLIEVNFEQDDSIAVKAKTGIVGGGFVTFGAGQFSLEVDAYYSQRKFGFEEADIVDTLNYFELPILARFRLLNKETWNLSAVGGAAVSLLSSAEETISGIGSDIKAAVKSNETAGVVGAQVGIGRWLVVDVRYLIGLTDVYTAEDFPAKSRGFQITGGFRVR
jgi:hypothetical protein